MKAHLLHANRDFDTERPSPWNAEALTGDLALNVLFEAMAKGDKFVLEIVRKVILSGFDNDLDTIRRRQDILNDCLNQPAVVRELRLSIELMESLLSVVRKLREVADSHAHEFVSDGWIEFFEMLKRELSDDYFAGVYYHLSQLKFRKGVLISAQLGKGNKGSRYVLRRPPNEEGTWLTRLFAWQRPPNSFSLDPRDEGGARALSELQDRGISLVAQALAQAADHVSSFFEMLRTELAFCVGCINLHLKLEKGETICTPSPMPPEERRLSFDGLYDISLALSLDQRVVGNDANADTQDLVIVTGANQGGKSTFLRSVGLAQLMMQCGMFVPAGSFGSSVCDGLFTHYKREEDASMKSGKLDEELSRMSQIVDHLTPRAMILFNESFAATNEREGSEIATQILSALLDKPFKMICVTHLYELARGFYERGPGRILFLRAERKADGVRTFKLTQGEPLQTSFGEDLYKRIFAVDATAQISNPAVA